MKCVQSIPLALILVKKFLYTLAKREQENMGSVSGWEYKIKILIVKKNLVTLLQKFLQNKQLNKNDFAIQ